MLSELLQAFHLWPGHAVARLGDENEVPLSDEGFWVASGCPNFVGHLVASCLRYFLSFLNQTKQRISLFPSFFLKPTK